MQDDNRLPPNQRRGYKNVFHGFYRIFVDEGPLALLKGTLPNVTRAMIMTTSQISTYNIIKQKVISAGIQDNMITQFGCSLSAGLIATTVIYIYIYIKNFIVVI